ncbi:hypothetical protein F2Q70_00020529 [Brassica cretica]|uniref:Uncharacterized protein n=1 Tax=Brassica cretica TaxID=69181 RepID=A0A8S9HNI6_BRACR|nr:hypothetical protein F2Q70_00020529 [Brassica cretica]KAF2558964.1 hypothetical protein F2Q68_00014051 [Brassica cretica]
MSTRSSKGIRLLLVESLDLERVIHKSKRAADTLQAAIGSVEIQTSIDTIHPALIDTIHPTSIGTVHLASIDTVHLASIDTVHSESVHLDIVHLGTVHPDTVHQPSIDTVLPPSIDTVLPPSIDTVLPPPIDTVNPPPIDTVQRDNVHHDTVHRDTAHRDTVHHGTVHHGIVHRMTDTTCVETEKVKVLILQGDVIPDVIDVAEMNDFDLSRELYDWVGQDLFQGLLREDPRNHIDKG